MALIAQEGEKNPNQNSKQQKCALRVHMQQHNISFESFHNISKECNNNNNSKISTVPSNVTSIPQANVLAL